MGEISTSIGRRIRDKKKKKGRRKMKRPRRGTNRSLLKTGFTCLFLEEAAVKIKRGEERKERREQGRGQREGQKEGGKERKRAKECAQALFHN